MDKLHASQRQTVFSQLPRPLAFYAITAYIFTLFLTSQLSIQRI